MLPWSHVCHCMNSALPGQKSSVLLPQRTSQRWPSVPTADDETNYFLFLQTTRLISSASDWKSNPAGSWVQFKPKTPQVKSNWPSHYLITVCVLRLQHFLSLVRPLPLPSVPSPFSWARFNPGALEGPGGLCNNILEEREDKKLELGNQRIQLSFEL